MFLIKRFVVMLLLLQEAFVPSEPCYLITVLLNSVLRSSSTLIIKTVSH